MPIFESLTGRHYDSSSQLLNRPDGILVVKMPSDPDTRTRILNSASAVIMRDGVGSLTLDRVAREAGVSKGGLLYHFSAKERLIEGLMERLIAEFDEDRTRFEAEEPTGQPGARTRAFIRATLEHGCRSAERRSDGPDLFAALLAAVAESPALLDPLRRKYAEWQSHMEGDNLPAGRATVLRLAADGLWFLELFRLTDFDPSARRRILQEMLRLTADEQRPRTRSVRH